MQRLLQEYAQKITTLEMKYLQALALAIPKGGDKSMEPKSFEDHVSSAGIRVEDVYGALFESQETSTINMENPTKNPSLSNSKNPSRSSSFKLEPGSNINPVVGFRVEDGSILSSSRSNSFTIKPAFEGSSNPLSTRRGSIQQMQQMHQQQDKGGKPN